MIKFFGLIPRRPDMTSEEFHDHYRHPHGTLGARITTYRGYVQSHQIACRLLGPDQRRFEAVAEVWFDTVEDATGLADDPLYVKHLEPDEPNFVDMDKLKWMFTVEEVIVSGPDRRAPTPLEHRLLQGMHLDRPTTVKLLHFVEDGAVDRDYDSLAGRTGAIRHVRCRPHPQAHSDEPAAFAEVHELWWPTVWDFEQGVGAGESLPGRGEDPGESVTMLVQAERFF